MEKSKKRKPEFGVGDGTRKKPKVNIVYLISIIAERFMQLLPTIEPNLFPLTVCCRAYTLLEEMGRTKDRPDPFQACWYKHRVRRRRHLDHL